jgi:hypothetical protein
MTHIAEPATVSYSNLRGSIRTVRLRLIGAVLMTLAAICIGRAAFLIVMDPPIQCGCRVAQPKPGSVSPLVVACSEPRTTYRGSLWPTGPPRTATDRARERVLQGRGSGLESSFASRAE